MMKSVATAVAGFMFVMGVALVSSVKMDTSKAAQHIHLRPSVEMLKAN